MAGDAVDIGLEVRAWAVWNTSSALTGVEVPVSSMSTGVAGGAAAIIHVRLGVQTMTNLAVALEALDLTLRDMPIVNERGIRELFQFLLLSVAGLADLLGDFTGSLNPIEVTLPASDLFFQERFVIEYDSCRCLNWFRWTLVA